MRWSSTSIDRDGVRLSVRETGRGQPVVLLAGLGTGQVVWGPVAKRLADRFRVVTFDHRGHGRSSTAPAYSFDLFLDDTAHILAGLAAPAGERPVLCGWSLGADLAVWQAARSAPGAIAGVVALDGAVPARMPQDDDDRVRRAMASPLTRALRWWGRVTKAGDRLPVDDLLAVGEQVEERRSRVLEAYAALSCPVTVALGARPPRGHDAMAAAGHAEWRAGAERLVASRPEVAVEWLDSDHALPLRRPDDVARLVEEVATR